MTYSALYSIIKIVKEGQDLNGKEKTKMEVLAMTDKQWKGWLRRFKRDLEDIKEAKTEEERNKKLDEMLDEIQQDLED